MLEKINQEKNKKCAIMGDFKADLLKIDTDSQTCDFYDSLTSYEYNQRE